MGAAAATIERALGSEDAEERRQATAEVGGMPVDAALPLLMRALGDEDWRVRKEATIAARALGTAAPLLAALVSALGDGENVGLRNAAVDVLASAGPAATAPLAEAFGQLDADGRKLVVEIFGKGRDPAALAALDAALDDPDDNVRQGAIEAVAALGPLARDRAEKVLLGRLDDRDHVVRLTALEGLTSLEVPIPWERLAPLVEDPTLRSAALSAAALSASPEAARALCRVLAGARGNAFELALKALGRIFEGPLAASVAPALAEGGADFGRRLVTAALPDGRGDDSIPRRATALRLAAAAAAPGLVDAAVGALSEEALAEAAQRALVALGPAALPEVIGWLDAPETSSAREARAALVDVIGRVTTAGGPHAGAALSALRRAVRDPERQVAVRALVALSRLGDAEDLELIAASTLEESRPLTAAAETALAALAARFPAAARVLADRLARDEGSLLPAAIAIGAATASSPFEESDAAFLAQAATAGDPRARRAAVHAVSEIRASTGSAFPGAMEVLRIALTDEEHEVRVAAARALGRLCTARDALRASDVLDLVDRSGESDLVAAAVRAVGEGFGLRHAAGSAPPADSGPGPRPLRARRAEPRGHRGRRGARPGAARRRALGDQRARERPRSSGRGRGEGRPPQALRRRGRGRPRRPRPRPRAPEARGARPRRRAALGRAARRRAPLAGAAPPDGAGSQGQGRHPARPPALVALDPRAARRLCPRGRRSVAVPRFDEIRLDQAEFRLLRELFNEHCGILFGPEARPVIERRLRDRLAALGLASFGEYYQLLRFDDRGRAEIDEAVDLITINETYFFREAYQLRAYKDEILPALRQAPAPRERLSVWSAGCSTGEEVYSIAICTRESGLFQGKSVRVFGSDISRRCVTHARRGVYGASAFRATAPEQRKRWFVERPDGMHVADDLRSMCQFGHLNLLDVPRTSVVGRVDVIFCRNVLIYFDDVSRRRVIDMFYDRLLPGGYLLLGHSESLLNVSTAFELVHLREDLVYRKPQSSGARFFATGDPFRRDPTQPIPAVPAPSRPGATGRPVPVPAPSDPALRRPGHTTSRGLGGPLPPEIAALIAEANAAEARANHAGSAPPAPEPPPDLPGKPPRNNR
ncbi:MAG: CheR family methyltransferase [Minicystis sp.]